MSGPSLTAEPLLTERDLTDAFALFKQLYPHITPESYQDRLREMRSENHYRLFGTRSQNEWVGLVGFISLTNLVYGKYLWVHDLVVSEGGRSRGIGRQLMLFVEQLAAEENCQFVALSAHIAHIEAQDFYQSKMVYEKRGFVYRSRLLGRDPFKTDRR
jgi:GNAT superfamily N-acetyltransferase